MMDAKDYVAVEKFDVLLSDIKAEDIARITIDNSQHLSMAKPDVPAVLPGITIGENARLLVKAIVGRSSSPTQGPINVIMLVDTGSPYVFLTAKTWNALGVDLENLPNDQAYIKVNGIRVLAHVSSNHFEDIDVLGASFLKNCRVDIDYPSQKATITVVDA